MEAAQKAGRTRALGVSNVSAGQLEEIWARASVKPIYVQNRTFTRPRSDAAVRQFCAKNSIFYEGFSLLTANPAALRHPAVVRTAKRLSKTAEQVVFRFCIQSEIVPLTGTTSQTHMAEDLAATAFTLDAEAMAAIAPLYP